MVLLSNFEKESRWIMVRIQDFTSKALFSTHAQIAKLGSRISGFCEPSSGTSKSCQVVGWDVCSLADWRLASPNTAPSAFDLNMDSAYALPQLSGGDFGYTWLPHVSHAVFSSGPIGGTFAMPPHPSDAVVDQLKAHHHAQSLMYGSAPSAVSHVPPTWAR